MVLPRLDGAREGGAYLFDGSNYFINRLSRNSDLNPVPVNLALMTFERVDCLNRQQKQRFQSLRYRGSPVMFMLHPFLSLMDLI